EINTAGKRGDLTSLVEQTVIGILQKLHVASKGNWDREREAAQHLDEADWAIRWDMFQEAQAAADSSWVLGLQTPEAAAARVSAYAGPARSVKRHWANGFSSGWGELRAKYKPSAWAEVTPPPTDLPLASLHVALSFADEVLLSHGSWV